MHMKWNRKTALYVLILLTLCFIWGNSLMPASVSGTISGRLAQLLSGLFPIPDAPDGGASDGVLRKLAHGTEFCILGAELAWLRHADWKSRWEGLALWGVAVALLDETIQLFVAGRSGMIRDVWIDLGGYTVGTVLCLLLCARLLRRDQLKDR